MNGSKKVRERLDRVNEDLIRLEAEFFKMVKDYCRAQIGLWRLIPSLALEADGRGSFRDCYNRAYNRRQWPLELRVGHLAVDLNTGEIINISPPHGNPPPRSAKEKELLALVGNLKEIDAYAIIEMLNENIKIPDGTPEATAEQVMERRKNLREEFDLSGVYTGK